MVSGQRVLLVAAEPREFHGLLRFCSGVRKLAWPVDWARYAECQGRQFWMAANGAGAALAGAATEVGCTVCRPDVIVSMGFCGALDPELRIGEIFVATAILGTGHASLPQLEKAAPHAVGPLASIDHVAQTSAEKADLRKSGAAAVEMEAAGVAARASAHHVRFYCVRSITDLAGQDFVLDFNKALRSDGHFGTINLLTSAFENPRQAFPELFRLRRSSLIATRTLGEFIAGCRF
jgi:adenosylhomocysteine nucleosidase